MKRLINYDKNGCIILPEINNAFTGGGGSNQNTVNYLSTVAPKNSGSTNASVQQAQLNNAALLTALSQYSPIGTVTIPNSPQKGTTVIITLTNATGATVDYFLLGNKTIALQYDAAVANPTSVSDGNLGASLNNFILSGNSMNLTSCLYTCNTGAGLTQFPQGFFHLSGDFDGTVKPINCLPAVAQNPANNNNDQLKFLTNWELTENNALVLKVLNTVTVQLIFTFQPNFNNA